MPKSDLVTLSFRVPRELAQMLGEAAAREESTASRILRLAIRYYCAQGRLPLGEPKVTATPRGRRARGGYTAAGKP